MDYYTLGRSGLRVTRLALGTMTFGDAWGWGANSDVSQKLFDTYVEAGGNFFDTADMYSLGVSEEVTGAALREYARLDQCVVATKVFNAMGRGPNMSGLSRKHIQQGCEASLKRLGVDVIDLYQVHRFDPHTPIDEMLAALDWLVRGGKVRYIGASSTAAWKFAQALSSSERHGWARFVSMQNHYNLIYREEEREMIPLCSAAGVAVLPWSPLARGLLAGTRNSATDTQSTTRAASDDYARKLYDHPSDWRVVEALHAVAGHRQAPPAQVALGWLLSKPAVTAPIVGATKLEHLESAIAALDVELTAEEIEALEKPYEPHAVRGFA